MTATNTITNTATETSTITEQTTIFTATSAVIAIPTFTVYAIGGPNNGNPMSNANGNIVRNTRVTSPPPVLQFTTVDINKLQVLNGPYAGSIGKTDPNASGSGAALYFGSTRAGLVDTACQVTYKSDGTCPLSCQAARGSTSFDCGAIWRIGSDADVANCNRFVPYAVGAA